jgi:hypothetical protein
MFATSNTVLYPLRAMPIITVDLKGEKPICVPVFDLV